MQEIPEHFGEANVRSQAKHWVGTWNSYPDDWEEAFVNIRNQVTYYVAGKEVAPTTGTPHIQFYIAYKKKVTFNTVSRHLRRAAWIYIKLGTVAQASNYCKKGEAPWKPLREQDPLFGINAQVKEFGDLPSEQHEKGGKATEEVWENNMKLAKKKKFDEMTPSHQILHYDKYRKYEVRTRKKPEALTWLRGESPNLWIYGPHGCGKSRKVYLEYPDAYRKMLNKWWDGYEEGQTVVIEDVGKSHAEWIGDFLKQWADIYPFMAEWKGGVYTCYLRPPLVIVTSNYHPAELWPDEKVREPIMDRFQMLHMNVRYQPPPRDIVRPPNYPMFDVVRDLFSVERAEQIPIGPIVPDTQPDRSVTEIFSSDDEL